MATRIGILSDTHGLLRPEALAFLQGCEHIVHGGDIGPAAILEQLAAIAPLTVVRGNNDRGEWAQAIPVAVTVEIAGVRIHAVHDIADLALDPRAEGIAIVVSGHSHRPSVKLKDGVTYLNPGSAGPRRFSLPISMAEVVVENGLPTVRMLEL
jgi:putative phosphoesterase